MNKLSGYIIIVFIVMMIPPSLRGQSIDSLQVSFSYNKLALKEVIDDLENKYAIRFTYRTFNNAYPVSIQYSGLLKPGLDLLFEDLPFAYKIIANSVVLKPIVILGQPIRGQVIDVGSAEPLIGATINVLNQPEKGTVTDVDGTFAITGLALGRYDLVIRYLGYESQVISQILVQSGKEHYLSIKLRESIMEFNEVVVVGVQDLTEPRNRTATTSARTFSVEESIRFAAAIADPARMVQSYAGVSSGGDDLSNEILIRGNSSRGLLWRLEGIEIPNPNHFTSYVSGGGAISMLSANMLTNSDFYTGAFPAEFGNAISGVFDLRLRKGNSEKRAFTLSVGNIGLSAAAEGYFSKNSDASYLVNFRYSTLQLIDQYLLTLNGSVPAYRDLTFKIHLPTEKAGTFNIFGLGGQNSQIMDVVMDSTLWSTPEDQISFREEQKLDLIGINHQYLLNDQSYLRNSILISRDEYFDLYHKVFPSLGYQPVKFDGSHFTNVDVRWSSSYHLKLDAKRSLQTGFIFNHEQYDYEYDSREIALGQEAFRPDESLKKYIADRGNSNLLQGYFQWQSKFNEHLEFNGGVHFSLLTLNNTYSIDPRLGFKYQLNEKHRLSLFLGHHSKPEHSSTYLIRTNDASTGNLPNINLSMLKAVHQVLGYDYRISQTFRIKAEAYFQYLYDIPIGNTPSNGFSILNVEDIFDIIVSSVLNETTLVSSGKGRNYGLDLTIEKFLDNGIYGLLTSSIFNSEYTPFNGKWYPTYAANNILFNVLGGKEWSLDPLQKSRLGLNAKFTYYGGRRDTPIDLEQSRIKGYEVWFPNQFFTKKLEPYIRFDLGVSYMINSRRSTHTFRIDVQNVFNRINSYTRYFDFVTRDIETVGQNGLIPFLTYTLQFSGREKHKE